MSLCWNVLVRPHSVLRILNQDHLNLAFQHIKRND